MKLDPLRQEVSPKSTMAQPHTGNITGLVAEVMLGILVPCKKAMRTERHNRIPFILWAIRYDPERRCPAHPLRTDAGIRVGRIVARTLDLQLDSLRPESIFMDLGADDLDVEEIIYFSEAALNLPEDSVWRHVTVRPARLTVGEILELFTLNA